MNDTPPPVAVDPGTFWDERYSLDEYVFGLTPNQWLAANEALLKPGMSAFLPGDGEGRNSVWLAQRGLTVTGVDASPVGVAKAKRLAAEKGVTIDVSCADLRIADIPQGQYDLAVCAFLHVGGADRAAIHKKVAASLKPGGLLILEGFTPDHLGYGKGGPPVADMMFSEAILRHDFGGLEILHLAELKTELPASERHGGKAAVVRLLARKK